VRPAAGANWAQRWKWSGRVELEGAIRGDLLATRSLSETWAIEAVAVLFKNTENPLASYPTWYALDDFRLRDARAYSEVTRRTIVDPDPARLAVDSGMLARGKPYGYGNNADLFRVGYEAAEGASIRYEASPFAYGVWGLDELGGVDGTVYNALALEARGLGGTCDLVVKLRSSPLSSAEACCEAQVRASAFATQGDDWAAAEIPLQEFRKENPTIDLASLDVLTLGFNEQLGSCDVQVRSLGLVRSQKYPELLPPPGLKIVQDPSRPFCVPSFSPVPECSVAFTGTVESLAPGVSYRVHAFARDPQGRPGWITGWGEVDGAGQWSVDLALPSPQALPGTSWEMSAALVDAASEQSQALLAGRWVDALQYEGLKPEAMAGSEFTMADLLPGFSPQLAAIPSAQFYGYSNLSGAADFRVKPYLLGDGAGGTEAALRTIYSGQAADRWAVWGIQNLDALPVPPYGYLVLDITGLNSGYLIVKLLDRNGCESEEVRQPFTAGTRESVSIPVTSFKGKKCLLALDAIDRLTFAFTGKRTIDVVIRSVEFSEQGP